MVITYIFLNLPTVIKQGSTVKATYTYLADGTKIKAVNALGVGFDYIGSFKYNRSNSNITLESVATAGGRTYKTSSGYEARYFISDHLGSTRLVASANGTVLEQNDYMPYGERHSNSALAASTNPYLYNGKESQKDFGINYIDSEARFQRLDGAFNSIDPLCEKYYHISPYAYCAANPIKLIDYDGKKPRIYIQTKGLGHAFLTVGDGENTIVYSYGRYGTIYGYSGITSGRFTPNGEGVLMKKQGLEAVEYLKEVLNEDFTVFEVNNNTDEIISRYYDRQMETGLSPSNQDKDTYGNPNAVVVDNYNLLSNNCVTKTIDGINSGNNFLEKDAISPNGFVKYLNEKANSGDNRLTRINDPEQVLNQLIEKIRRWHENRY